MQVPCLFGMELAFAYGLFSGGGRIARREHIGARKRLFRRGAALKIAGFSRCVSKKEALCEKAGESKARQRYSKSMEGKTAPLSTHISFFARHSHPYQFLMKSSDFRAQKLQGNDFCSDKWDFLPQNRPLFTRHRIQWTSERALTLSSSPRLFDSPSWRSHVIRCRSEPALPIDFRDESQKHARPVQK